SNCHYHTHSQASCIDTCLDGLLGKLYSHPLMWSNQLSQFVTHVRHNQTFIQFMTSHKSPSTENRTHCDRECDRVDCISHYSTKTRMQKYKLSGYRGITTNRANLRFENSPYYVHEATPTYVLFE